MAQTEHLPIYKASYDLCLYVEQVVAKFARTHRHGLGAELREGARSAARHGVAVARAGVQLHRGEELLRASRQYAYRP